MQLRSRKHVGQTRIAIVGLLSALMLAAGSCSSSSDAVVMQEPSLAEAPPVSEDAAAQTDVTSINEDELSPLSSDRVVELMALIDDGSGFAGVYLQGSERFWLRPWVTRPELDADRLVFESEIGVASDEIEAIAQAGSGVVVAAISADADEALTRVLSSSPWADVATVEDLGSYTLLGFGAELDLSRKSLLRPIGQPGEMALADGILIWSANVGDVRALLEAGPTTSYDSIVQAATGFGPWTQIEVFPARSVAGDLERLCEVDCRPALLDNARALITQYGNPVRFEMSLVIENKPGNDIVLLVAHKSAGLAKENARRMPAVFDKAVSYSSRRAMTEDFDLGSVEVDGNFVVLHMTEKLENAAGGLFVTPMLTWDE